MKHSYASDAGTLDVDLEQLLDLRSLDVLLPERGAA